MMGWIEDLTDAVEKHRNERIAANTSAEALWAQGTSGFSGEETDCNRSAGKLAALSDQPRGKVVEKSRGISATHSRLGQYPHPGD